MGRNFAPLSFCEKHAALRFLHDISKLMSGGRAKKNFRPSWCRNGAAHPLGALPLRKG